MKSKAIQTVHHIVNYNDYCYQIEMQNKYRFIIKIALDPIRLMILSGLLDYQYPHLNKFRVHSQKKTTTVWSNMCYAHVVTQLGRARNCVTIRKSVLRWKGNSERKKWNYAVSKCVFYGRCPRCLVVHLHLAKKNTHKIATVVVAVFFSCHILDEHWRLLLFIIFRRNVLHICHIA